MRASFIVILFLLLFSLFPKSAFAADYKVSGKILDAKNNPVAQGAVVFVDPSGKTIGAATSDITGSYTIDVAKGTYAISASGPKGAKYQSSTLSNQTITAPITVNFILSSPQSVEAKKPTLLQSLLPFLVGGIVLLLLFIVGVIFWRKKKQTPLSQPSSSH